MAYLVYYSKEKEEFKEAFGKELSVQYTNIVYRKLCRHWKISPVRLEWTSGRNHPHASYGITLNKDWNNFGVLCHEFAHHYGVRRLSNRGHNKLHWKLMKKMIRYCEKKNWFEEELKRRFETPKLKSEPTKQEIRLKMIERLEKGIKRHQTKIKRCQTLIRKNQRRISALKRFI